jgi:hypothetical protein
VPVDETRRDDLTGRIDFFFSFFANAPNRRNPIAAHRDVRSISGVALFRRLCAVTNHEIVHADSSSVESTGTNSLGLRLRLDSRLSHGLFFSPVSREIG